MERKIGTVSRGVRCPIIREGDNLCDIVVNSVLEAAQSEGFELRNRDVVGITESIVARAQGNYATVDAIAEDVKAKTGGETVGVIFPITSRNRFAINLKGIAMGCKKVVLMLSYPSDEVGNALLTYDQIDAAGINPYSDVLTLERYRELFGENIHEFTGVDYVDYYSNIVKEAGAEVEVIFANQAKTILDYTDCIINCDIHTRVRTKRILKAAGAKIVLGLDDILNAPVNGSGYNTKYGLLGSNKATEDKIKLFPNECKDLVLDIQNALLEKTGKLIEVMVYGDGAFKDPQGKIWELADPVVSPAFTSVSGEISCFITTSAATVLLVSSIISNKNGFEISMFSKLILLAFDSSVVIALTSIDSTLAFKELVKKFSISVSVNSPVFEPSAYEYA